MSILKMNIVKVRKKPKQGFRGFGGASRLTSVVISISIIVLYSTPLPVTYAQPFDYAAALTLNAGQRFLWSALMDSTSGFAYFGTETSPGIIVKVRLSDFTLVGALTLNQGEDDLASAVIDAGNGYAYFGTNTIPAKVVKVRLSDLTRVGALELSKDLGEILLRSAVIDTANGFAYFGTSMNPSGGDTGKVVKVDLSTFTRAGALSLQPGEDVLNLGVIDPVNGYAYFSAQYGGYPRGPPTPGMIVKIRLSDFTRVQALTLNDGETPLDSAIIDAASGFAYFGTGTAPGVVVKIDLATFTPIGAATLGPGEDSLASAVIDSVNGFGYFGTSTKPGRVVKLKLSDLTRVEALILNQGQDILYGAVIDTSNGFAYFGTNTSPGIVVKVKIGSASGQTTTPSNTGTSGPVIAGFPLESILGGLLVSLAVLAIIRTRREKNSHGGQQKPDRT